jgi:hypothetical protein
MQPWIFRQITLSYARICLISPGNVSIRTAVVLMWCRIEEEVSVFQTATITASVCLCGFCGSHYKQWLFALQMLTGWSLYIMQKKCSDSGKYEGRHKTAQFTAVSVVRAASILRIQVTRTEKQAEWKQLKLLTEQPHSHVVTTCRFRFRVLFTCLCRGCP